MKKLVLLLVFFMLASANISFAQIIINSQDWRDVYSGMLYGSLIDRPADFLVSTRHSTLILNTISRTSEVRALSSRRSPFMVGYNSVIQGRGFTSEEVIYDDFNFELAQELDYINDFIIIDSSYGYNAISVAPYAVLTDSFVLFADRTNIRRIDDFLSDRGVDSLIIYGHVDREVRNTLEKYDPEIINNEGDRFLNNIEIVRKFREIKPARQVILTNGEFIEKEIMSGVEPVIFIGANNVPDSTRDYIHGTNIDIGVLIGNELVGTATTIRRDVGISVFVKFAQGARAPQGAISQVEALDMFYLPTYILRIELESVRYNRATGRLEVSIRNTEAQAVYFKGTYSLRDTEGNAQSVGDLDPIFLDGNEVRTLTYDIDPMSGNITGSAYILYGESRNSLEKVLEAEFNVEIIDVLDNCDIDIKSLVYDRRRKQFELELENIADVTCYAYTELVDVMIDGQLVNLGSEGPVEISPGRKARNIIKADLFDEDFADNEIIRGRVYYGEREGSLVNIKDFQFELAFKSLYYSLLDSYLTFTLIIVIVIIIILILIKRRRKDEDDD